MWSRQRGDPQFSISIRDCSSSVLRVAVRSLKTEDPHVARLATTQRGWYRLALLETRFSKSITERGFSRGASHERIDPALSIPNR